MGFQLKNFKQLEIEKLLHTFCTWMASLLCGSSHVSSSGQLLRSSCRTLSIYERLLSFVGPLMLLQVASYWEALVVLSHFEHLKGFSPVWVLSYSFKEHDLEKLLLHFVCLNGISPVCVLSCSFKWPAIEKLLSHFEHLKGFSPVWVLHVQRDALVTLIAL